jgi:small conductance mechanosensitive channel
MKNADVDETLMHFLGNVLYALLLIFVVLAALSQLGVNTT